MGLSWRGKERSEHWWRDDIMMKEEMKPESRQRLTAADLSWKIQDRLSDKVSTVRKETFSSEHSGSHFTLWNLILLLCNIIPKSADWFESHSICCLATSVYLTQWLQWHNSFRREALETVLHLATQITSMKLRKTAGGSSTLDKCYTPLLNVSLEPKLLLSTF